MSPAWRVAVLITLAAGAWALKRHYADSHVEALRYILAPTSKLVSWLTGVSFEFEYGVGYLSKDRLFAIAKPCAGVNFMVAAWALLGFVLSRRARDFVSGIAVLVESLVLAYAAALVANAARIALALKLDEHVVVSDFWTPARIHRVLGIVVYFGGLALLQGAATRRVTAARCST
jgi:exosortase K